MDRHVPFSVLVLLGLLAACQPAVDPISLVNTLRVLTVRAEPPEVGPTGTVRLTPLTVDPNGGGRPLTHSWRVCDPRLPVYDPALDCPVETAFTLPAVGDDGSEAELNLPDFLAHLSSGASGGVDLEALQAQLAELTGTSSRPGLPLQVLYTVSAERTEEEIGSDQLAEVVSLKRVTLSQSEAPNQNPRIMGLRFDEEDWTDLRPLPFSKEQEIELGAWLEPSSFEVYTQTNLDGVTEDKTEELSLSWFVTLGKVGGREREYADPAALPPADEPYESQTTTYTQPASPPQVFTSTFWLVLIDGRGGVDWKSAQVAWE